MVNGFSCKSASSVTVNDFFHSGLHIAGNTSNPFGRNTTGINVKVFPGLNTLGISMSRVDFAPRGVNPPHIHPRSSEMITVIEGSILVGFVTSSPEYKLFSKVLQKGDVFVFPIGLVHFSRNVGSGHAVAFNVLNSQNPGAIFMGENIFGSQPPINSDILAKAFQVDKKIINEIQFKF